MGDLDQNICLEVEEFAALVELDLDLDRLVDNPVNKWFQFQDMKDMFQELVEFVLVAQKV